MRESRERVSEKSDMKRKEVQATKTLKCEKAPGIDGMAAETFKLGQHLID